MVGLFKSDLIKASHRNGGPEHRKDRHRASRLMMPHQGAIGTGCVMMVEVAPLAAAFSA